MMEQLFNDIRTRIADATGAAVTMTDEDWGQLDALRNGEAQYPVTFPCVLISMPSVEWRSVKTAREQSGTLTLTVRLAFDCRAEASAAQRMILSRRLDACLNGEMFDGCARPLVRRRTQCTSMPGGIRVYEHTYDTTVVEQEEPAAVEQPAVKQQPAAVEQPAVKQQPAASEQ